MTTNVLGSDNRRLKDFADLKIAAATTIVCVPQRGGKTEKKRERERGERGTHRHKRTYAYDISGGDGATQHCTVCATKKKKSLANRSARFFLSTAHKHEKATPPASYHKKTSLSLPLSSLSFRSLRHLLSACPHAHIHPKPNAAAAAAAELAEPSQNCMEGKKEEPLSSSSQQQKRSKQEQQQQQQRPAKIPCSFGSFSSPPPSHASHTDERCRRLLLSLLCCAVLPEEERERKEAAVNAFPPVPTYCNVRIVLVSQ